MFGIGKYKDERDLMVEILSAIKMTNFILCLVLGTLIAILGYL